MHSGKKEKRREIERERENTSYGKPCIGGEKDRRRKTYIARSRRRRRGERAREKQGILLIRATR